MGPLRKQPTGGQVPLRLRWQVLLLISPDFVPLAWDQKVCTQLSSGTNLFFVFCLVVTKNGPSPKKGSLVSRVTERV